MHSCLWLIFTGPGGHDSSLIPPGSATEKEISMEMYTHVITNTHTWMYFYVVIKMYTEGECLLNCNFCFCLLCLYALVYSTLLITLFPFSHIATVIIPENMSAMMNVCECRAFPQRQSFNLATDCKKCALYMGLNFWKGIQTNSTSQLVSQSAENISLLAMLLMSWLIGNFQ